MRITDHEFVQRTRVLPAVHSASGIPVDIVLAGPGIEELFLERAELRELRGEEIPVACPEDVAVMKVLAGRAKDIEDVLAIVRATGEKFRHDLARATLDLLERALDRRDLLPVFEQALQEVGSAVAAQKRTRAKNAKKTVAKKKRSASGAQQKSSKRPR